MARGECVLSPGAASWMNLPPSILSQKGKDLVTRDPDLSAETIQSLCELEKTGLEEFPFYFSSDEKSSDIGMATLSMCIRENTFATMAEVVARYADMRNIPYAHAAFVLNAIRRRYGFTVYLRNRTDNTYRAMRWEPAELPERVSVLPPPKRRA